MTPFERFIAKPVHTFVVALGKILGEIARAIGME